MFGHAMASRTWIEVNGTCSAKRCGVSAGTREVARGGQCGDRPWRWQWCLGGGGGVFGGDARSRAVIGVDAPTTRRTEHCAHTHLGSGTVCPDGVVVGEVGVVVSGSVAGRQPTRCGTLRARTWCGQFAISLHRELLLAHVEGAEGYPRLLGDFYDDVFSKIAQPESGGVERCRALLGGGPVHPAGVSRRERRTAVWPAAS